MVWNSSRWNVYVGGEEVFVMLVDERLSVMGWVENGCTDGWMGCDTSRMTMGDATSWDGLFLAQTT